MADNTQLPVPNTSGDIIATDDISGVKYQRVKLIHGAEGVNDGDVSSVNPLPVAMSSSPLPTNAATEATSQEIKTLQESILAMQTEIKDLNDTILCLMSAMLEKMPRVTANDQAAVSLEGGTLGTLTTLTTCATLTNQTQIGGQEALTTARSQIMAGTQHIYSNITVA